MDIENLKCCGNCHYSCCDSPECFEKKIKIIGYEYCDLWEFDYLTQENRMEAE